MTQYHIQEEVCVHVHSCMEVKRNPADETESTCSKALRESCSEKGKEIPKAMNMEITCWYSYCRMFSEFIICKRAEQQRITWVSLTIPRGRNNLKDHNPLPNFSSANKSITLFHFFPVEYLHSQPHHTTEVVAKSCNLFHRWYVLVMGKQTPQNPNNLVECTSCSADDREIGLRPARPNSLRKRTWSVAVGDSIIAFFAL